jgi:hypothetical protein
MIRLPRRAPTRRHDYRPEIWAVVGALVLAGCSGGTQEGADTVDADGDVEAVDVGPYLPPVSAPSCGVMAPLAEIDEPCDTATDGYSCTADAVLLRCEQGSDDPVNGVGSRWATVASCEQCRAGWCGEESLGYCDHLPLAPLDHMWRDPCITGNRDGRSGNAANVAPPACLSEAMATKDTACTPTEDGFACDPFGDRVRCMKKGDVWVWADDASTPNCASIGRRCVASRCGDRPSVAVCTTLVDGEPALHPCEATIEEFDKNEQGEPPEKFSPCDPDVDSVACGYAGKTFVCRKMKGVGDHFVWVEDPQECDISEFYPDGRCRISTCRGVPYAVCGTTVSHQSREATEEATCQGMYATSNPPLVAVERDACPTSLRGEYRCHFSSIYQCDPEKKHWTEVVHCGHGSALCKDAEIASKLSECGVSRHESDECDLCTE